MELDKLKEKYKLSAYEFEEIQQLIIEIYTADIGSSAAPAAIILGGQPGSGKGELITAAHHLALLNKEGVVTCNADDYRDFHPMTDEIKKFHEEYYPAITVEYSHRWNVGLRKYCEENKLNYILETTFSSGELMNDTIREIKQVGYQVLIMLLAIHERWSLLGAYFRYEDMKKTTGYGRLVTKEQHDTRYKQIPVTLKTVQQSRLYDHMLICTRVAPGADGNGRGVYLVADNPSNPLKTYLSVRNKRWPKQTIEYFHKSCGQVIELMKLRNDISAVDEFCKNMGISHVNH